MNKNIAISFMTYLAFTIGALITHISQGKISKLGIYSRSKLSKYFQQLRRHFLAPLIKDLVVIDSSIDSFDNGHWIGQVKQINKNTNRFCYISAL